MSVVFADGEPVDPYKLRKLQDQITEVTAVAGNAYNLISTTVNGNTTSSVFHSRGGTLEFDKIAKDSLNEKSCGFSWDSTLYKRAFTVATPRIGNPKETIVRVSVTSGTGGFSPTVHVYCSEKREQLLVDWISVAEKIVE